MNIDPNTAKAILAALVGRGAITQADADAYLYSLGDGGGPPDAGPPAQKRPAASRAIPSHVCEEIDRRMGVRSENAPVVSRARGGLAISNVRPMRIAPPAAPQGQRIERCARTGRLLIG